MISKIFCLILVLISVCVSAQDIAPRIAGLEGDSEYMSLLTENVQLREREDSILLAIGEIRERFSADEDSENRARYAGDIIELESQIFKMRNAQGRIINKINTIEQNWVLLHLNAPQERSIRPISDNTTPDSLKVRNLIYNQYFVDNLPATDYKMLQEMQVLEMKAVNYVNRYLSNYNEIASLAEQYAATAIEKEADSLLYNFETLKTENNLLNDSLSLAWCNVFDNKSYAYGYLLEKSRQDDILTKQSEKLEKVNGELLGLDDSYVSKAVADYFIRKKVIVEYEISVAKVFSLDASVDSLKGVVMQLESVDFKLPKISIAERSFIDFEPIKYPSKTPYNYKNPIPKCTIYKNGTVYRILLGTFNTKRAVSTFRGATPLSYIVDKNKKWNYYAGGYATLEEAETAQKAAKKRGFVRPEVVVWHDGVMRNLTQDPEEVGVVQFRIEIATESILTDAVKTAISLLATEQELSRIDQQGFVIRAFSSRESAQVIADALKIADASLQISITEIEGENHKIDN